MAGAVGGGVSGFAAPGDLLVHDAFRGEFSSASTYGRATAFSVGGGLALGSLFGLGSRIIGGPASRLPGALPREISPIGGEPPPLVGSGEAAGIETKTWGAFLPQAEQRLANAYATYGGKGIYNVAGRLPPGEIPAELLPNQLPERLSAELADAARLGVKPIPVGGPGFEEAVNQGTVKFVVTESGELVVAPHTVEGVEISHAVLSGGRPVVTAGQAEIAAAEGQFFGIGITEHSGHFLPPQERLEFAKRLFAQFGIKFP